MGKKYNTEDFIKNAKAIHGDKYDYSKVEYINSKTKVCIVCPEHGEFWQTPEKHFANHGCHLCGGTKHSCNEDFIIKANSIHNNKYDYSKVEYVNNKSKVCIICPEHGEFFQEPHNHLKGKGCPVCAKEITRPKKYNTEKFINESIKIHGYKYDYSKTDYIDESTKVCIICPNHGEFWQTPYLHLNGSGCKKCAVEKNGIEKRKTTEHFIEKAKLIHGNEYDYSKAKYITAKNKVCIICKKHGEFWQSPWHHLSGCGCPSCSHPVSKIENEIVDYLKSILGDVEIEQNNRKVLNGKELDIYIPSLKFAIEYNGLYWHTDNIHSDRNYHLNKTKECNKNGIKLIQIFEDEYLNKKEIVLSSLSHILKKSNDLPKIMARKCKIKEISIKESKEFLNKNHIQGFGCGTIHLGAFYKEKLIGVMVFKTENNGKWELNRFATDNSYICPGVGGKLFNFFIKNYNPIEIKSFADRRWTTNENNNLYIKLGFKLSNYTSPDYRYFKMEDGIIRQHKFKFRKQKLSKKYGLPIIMTENEMTKKLGYSRIYDCGLIKYIWKKQ